MSIPELDIKVLWGKSAGRCAFCNKDLLSESPKAVQGEMAHIIAKSKRGPRGSNETLECDRNGYENLILLCPNDHTEIDSHPDNYTVECIRKKKTMHEEKVRLMLEGRTFATVAELFSHSLKLLNENKSILDLFGPGSPVAQKNPVSSTKQLWDLRKVAKIIPNNTEIISIFEKNGKLLNVPHNLLFSKFREHAIAFENNTYERLDSQAVPVFPIEFRKMLEEVVI
ncbi:MAG TPA: HNH endonuclease signature motif containing protein [Gammaproteobacteria bacterium]|jgi:hypothetical protein|nr:HNH endonuclease signature motif containing protein [Gammaproteobacteria bacterium]